MLTATHIGFTPDEIVRSESDALQVLRQFQTSLQSHVGKGRGAYDILVGSCNISGLGYGEGYSDSHKVVTVTCEKAGAINRAANYAGGNALMYFGLDPQNFPRLWEIRDIFDDATNTLGTVDYLLPMVTSWVKILEAKLKPMPPQPSPPAPSTQTFWSKYKWWAVAGGVVLVGGVGAVVYAGRKKA